jgi:hypothetical protein
LNAEAVSLPPALRRQLLIVRFVSVGRASGERIMPSYGPELIQTMRTVLEEVMTKIPVDQATPSVKVHLAEFILKAAAEGQTTYDSLLTSTSSQIQTILSMLS